MEFTNWDFQIYDSPVDLVSYSILGAYIFPCICERKVCFLGATIIQGESIKTIIRSNSFLIDFIEKKNVSSEVYRIPEAWLISGLTPYIIL